MEKSAAVLPVYESAGAERQAKHRFVKFLVALTCGIVALNMYFPSAPCHRRGAGWRVPGPEFSALAGRVPLADLKASYLSLGSNDSIAAFMRPFTEHPHVAGTHAGFLSQLAMKRRLEQNLGVPESGEDRVFEAGSPESRDAFWHATNIRSADKPSVWMDTYFPLMSYPVEQTLTIHAKNGSFNVSLLEDKLADDPSSQTPSPFPIFHGYSKNGTASGPLVYGGFCSAEELAARDLRGAVVLCRYGRVFRGLKVSSAQRRGAVAVLVYSDPGDDGSATEEAGAAPYPAGPARQPSSVQRGSVQFLSEYPGDPLTPGTPAYRDAPRLDPADPSVNIPQIPSIPVSYVTALALFKELEGHGKELPGEGGLEYFGGRYFSGPSKTHVELTNIMDTHVAPIHNTYAFIPGHIRDEVVVLGNHNDAWVFGASDPISGTATLLETTKALGTLLSSGWRPLRSILIASWDAEEYGLLGSTEYGEDFAPWVAKHVVAYLNVDGSVSGSRLVLDASPSLAGVLLNATAAVIGTEAASKLTVEPLGSGSDFTVFLQHIGVAALALGHSKGRDDPVYHYHSIFDSQDWMERFGDPGFHRNLDIVKIYGLVTLDLVESVILPISVTDYAAELETYVDLVARLSAPVDLEPLYEAVARIQSAAIGLEIEGETVRAALADLGDAPPRNPLKLIKFFKLLARARSVNRRLRLFERGFIDEAGLAGRTWYKNLVVAPGLNLGYGATTLPGLTESITLDDNPVQAQVEVGRLVALFDVLAEALEG